MSKNQMQMDLEVVAHTEVDGLEMGVLRDGTPYLSGRGLAALCTVTQKAIQTLAQDFFKEPTKGSQSSYRKNP